MAETIQIIFSDPRVSRQFVEELEIKDPHGSTVQPAAPRQKLGLGEFFSIVDLTINLGAGVTASLVAARIYEAISRVNSSGPPVRIEANGVVVEIRSISDVEGVVISVSEKSNN